MQVWDVIIIIKLVQVPTIVTGITDYIIIVTLEVVINLSWTVIIVASTEIVIIVVDFYIDWETKLSDEGSKWGFLNFRKQ